MAVLASPEAGDIRPYWQNYIGGAWVDALDGRRRTLVDPATGSDLAECALGGVADIDAAVAAARSCADSRALTSVRPVERSRWVMAIGEAILARRDEAATILTRDCGKSLSSAYNEIDATARYFEYYGSLADKIEGRSIPLGDGLVDYTIPTPHGVSAHVTPWNFPAVMIGRGAAPALAAGNAVVVKAPELDPLSCLVIAEAIDSVGLPDGAFNMVVGDGHEAGAALVAHEGIDQIVFTGSVPTGRSILRAAAERIIPTVMELGGKSAAVVYDDADLDAVMASVRAGIFGNAGQICSAMSRMIVTPARHDEVVDALIEVSHSLTIGPGIENSDLTPLVSERQLERVSGFTERAIAEGATAATGGRRADTDGFFMEPTVLVGVEPTHEVACEEVFGPVLSVLRSDSPEAAVELANATDYALAAGVFTQDIDRALWTADRLHAGQVYVNEWFAGGVETPFGGFRRSGYGREKGQEALMNYYQSKNVGIRVRQP